MKSVKANTSGSSQRSYFCTEEAYAIGESEEPLKVFCYPSFSASFSLQIGSYNNPKQGKGSNKSAYFVIDSFIERRIESYLIVRERLVGSKVLIHYYYISRVANDRGWTNYNYDDSKMFRRFDVSDPCQRSFTV